MVAKTSLTANIHDAARRPGGSDAPSTAPFELGEREVPDVPKTPPPMRRGTVRDIIRSGYEALLSQTKSDGPAALERHAACMRAALRNNDHALAEHHRQRLIELDADDTLIASIGRRRIAPTVPPRVAAVLSYADLVSEGSEGKILAHASAMTALGIGPGELAELTKLIALVGFQSRFSAELNQNGDMS